MTAVEDKGGSDAMHAQSGAGHVYQQRIDLGAKTTIMLYVLATVTALAIAALVWDTIIIHWYRVEERLHQDADVHLQSDYIDPLKAKVDGLEHEVQALTNRFELRQELQRHDLQQLHHHR